MKTKLTSLWQCVIVMGVLAGLPLLGVIFKGRSIHPYMEFPPLTQYVEHAPFSWPIFLILTAMILVVVVPFDLRVLKSRFRAAEQHTTHSRRAAAPFPWWGWAGIAVTLLTWIAAWSRIPWFAPFQVFTFSPLWLGYILAVNGLTLRRTGSCRLTASPWQFALLFVMSAGFWWFFEYLNRFVQNWYYTGITDISPAKYVLFATLPFATVLPAVMSTYDCLASFPQAGAGTDRFIRIDMAHPKSVAWVVLGLACIGLTGIAIWPNLLFPMLWLSPLYIITSLQTLAGQRTIFTPVRQGNWRRLYLLAAAALICGFFWELWNYESVAKWIYTVPYVNRFKLFEMPILGFAGYLPFGLECAVIADMLTGNNETTDSNGK